MALKSEQLDIKAALKEIQGVVEDVVIDVSLNASRNLFKETPQVTTFTASNWNPSIGTPDPEVRGVTEARINREKQTAALLKYRLNQGKTFIQNSVRHIEELNARGGKSKRGGERKPAAFAQRAVAKAVRQTLRRLRKRSRAGSIR